MNPLIDMCAQAGKEIQNKEKVNLPSCIGQRTLDPHHFVSDQKIIRVMPQNYLSSHCHHY